jgi:hypothetical protein
MCQFSIFRVGTAWSESFKEVDMPKWFRMQRWSILLLLSLFGVYGVRAGFVSAKSDADLLQFILAEQAKTLARVSNVSYTKTISGKGTDLLEGTSDIYSDRVNIIQEGDSVWASIERDERHMGKSGTEEMRVASRAVANDAYVAVWPDISEPQVRLYSFDDYSEPEDRMRARSKLQGATLAEDLLDYMFGCNAGSLGFLVKWDEQFPEQSRPKWSVNETRRDGRDVFIASRTIIQRGVVDLEITIDPGMGFVVTRLVDHGAGDGRFEQTEDVSYEKVGDIWFPKQITSKKRSGGGIDVVTEESTIQIDDVVIGPEVDDNQFTIRGLELPDDCLVLRSRPNDNYPDLMRFRGGEIIPAPDLHKTSAIVH